MTVIVTHVEYDPRCWPLCVLTLIPSLLDCSSERSVDLKWVLASQCMRGQLRVMTYHLNIIVPEALNTKNQTLCAFPQSKLQTWCPLCCNTKISRGQNGEEDNSCKPCSSGTSRNLLVCSQREMLRTSQQHRRKRRASQHVLVKREACLQS